MAKIVDITSKLSFDENPVMVIKGHQIEVQSDAKTMLLIMGDFSNLPTEQAVLAAYSKLFNEADRAKIEAMKLPFKDLQVIIESAMIVAQGEDVESSEQGEM